MSRGTGAPRGDARGEAQPQSWGNGRLGSPEEQGALIPAPPRGRKGLPAGEGGAGRGGGGRRRGSGAVRSVPSGPSRLGGGWHPAGWRGEARPGGLRGRENLGEDHQGPASIPGAALGDPEALGDRRCPGAGSPVTLRLAGGALEGEEKSSF